MNDEKLSSEKIMATLNSPPSRQGRHFAFWTLLLGIAAGCFAQGFTDVTVSSGVLAVVKAHYDSLGGAEWKLNNINLVDLDGDNDLDLYLGNHGGYGAGAWNDGSGHFTMVNPKMNVPRTVAQRVDLPIPGNEVRIFFDFDEDGLPDAATALAGDGTGASYRNVSVAGNPPVWNFQRSTVMEYFHRSSAIADINKDGVLDFLRNNADDNVPVRYQTVHWGTSLGHFQTVGEDRYLIADANSLTRCGIPLDMNGDGKLDLLIHTGGYVANSTGQRVWLNQGNDGEGKPVFSDVTESAGLPRFNEAILGAGDINNDGNPDIISAGDSEVVAYINDGTAHFTRKVLEKTHSINTPNWGMAQITDFDNDGSADIMLVIKFFMHIYRGTGGGNFQVVNSAWGIPTEADPGQDEGLCFGDIDGDGRLDVLVKKGNGYTQNPDIGRTGPSVGVYKNNLPVQNWIRVRPVGKPGNRAATGAKIRLYEPGTRKLLWYEQVAYWSRSASNCYYNYALTERHFGLGTRPSADVEVEFYPSGSVVRKAGMSANQTVTVYEKDAANVQLTNALPANGRIAIEARVNPLKTAMAISYEIRSAHELPVRLTIYNSSGKCVAILTDGRMSPGLHLVKWNATGAPGGAYVARLTAGAQEMSKKILLLK